MKKAPSALQGRKVRIDSLRGTTLFHHYLATMASWVPAHPNPLTGVPGGSYFRSCERFTATAHEGASKALWYWLAPPASSLQSPRSYFPRSLPVFYSSHQ